jgi:biopolymer transport protein ExbB/TolQ
MTRLPLYGYLGTVCGILLMAQELGRIDEASQTFTVLSSMATGLVLAFKTTLVALLAYLPLRKIVDLLLMRLAELEKRWRLQREEFNNK